MSSSQATGMVPGGSPSEEDEIPAYLNSRLAGIRKLLVSLGRRSLIQDAAASVRDSSFEPRPERTTGRHAYKDQAPFGGAGNSPSSGRVTVRPEILRPRTVVDVDKDREPLRPTLPQPLRDRADAQDEIETLPSVRGQYRKKRYPPI